ncbi:MAG: hypothetical protein U0840_18895 [Gemmataceae bacterium]
MHIPRVLSPAALLLAACALATAQSPGTTVSPPPLLSVLLPYVGNKAFHDELKLTEAQAKRLSTFRQKMRDETNNTAPKDLKTGEQDKAFVAELKATLDADQVRRANQLAAGIVLRDDVDPFSGRSPSNVRTVSATLLARYGEIAAALKLDETQAKLVELVNKTTPKWGGIPKGGARTLVYLTPAQTAAAKALVDKAPATPLRAEIEDSRGKAFTGFDRRSDNTISYLAAPDVQKDLHLSAEQIKTVAALRVNNTNRSNSFGRGRRSDLNLSPAEQKKANDARLAEVKAAVEKLLTADQKMRLEQIGRQQRSVVDEEFGKSSTLGEALGVTDEQRKAYADANAALAAAVVKAVGSGEPLEKVRSAVNAARQARTATIEKILNADQVAKKQAWFGKPFTGSTSVAIDRGRTPAGSPFGSLQKAFFGKYSAELTTLTRYPKLREELKLTEEQATRLSKATGTLSEKFPAQGMRAALQDPVAGEKLLGDRSAFIEKTLADILTKEQRARFREVLIQQAEAARGTPGLALRSGAVSIPGVAEAIKLTAEQKKNILDGTPEATVLTDNQKAAIKAMRGKEVQIAAIFGRSDFSAFQPTSRQPLPRAVTLTQTLAYWDAIKVTPEQAARLAAAFNKHTLGTVGSTSSAEHQKALQTALEAILSADQRKRLEQLSLQSDVASSLVSALLGTARTPSAIRTELGITDEQAKAIRAAETELRELASLLDQNVGRFQSVEDATGKEATALRLKLRDRLDARIEGLLTGEQKEKWKAKLGEPHAAFTKQPLSGSRAGGGRGFAP